MKRNIRRGSLVTHAPFHNVQNFMILYLGPVKISSQMETFSRVIADPRIGILPHFLNFDLLFLFTRGVS